ncbi:encapsulin [Streptomyces sp. NPDC057486]|uniref:encapsulin n=1 Tax=Streptomyces sp. NPDC057486 TaxID=3346145 RepID=UPI0036A7D087
MKTPAATTDLHRHIALITSAARARIEEGARHAFRRRMADRCVLDVSDPAGPGLAAVGTGHVSEIAPPTPGAAARLREAKPLVELRVPFTAGSTVVDDVERGSHDVDRQPVQGAARATAHDAHSVGVYDHETLTYLTYTDRAVIVQEASDLP